MTTFMDAPDTLAHDDGRICTVDGLPGWFTLRYQPEVELATDRIVGAEAILRWWSPEFGLCCPTASLQHSQREDVLAEVEAWSVRAALREARLWADEGRVLPVAVNLSRERVEDPALADDIGAALEETGVAGSLLSIDVPLVACTKAPVPTAELGERLHDFGVGLIIDGLTGDRWRESIEPAHPTAFKVPVHWADRHHEDAHPSMARAAVLAADLGAATVAKEVDDDDLLGAVRRLGFERASGHAISDPVEPDLLPVAWDPEATAA